MNLKFCVNIYVLFTTLLVFGQEGLYTSLTIPAELKENANAVIRLHQIDVDINAVDDMHIKGRKVITVLNKRGDKHVQT
ncbi:hypothetical protein C1A40_09820 [Tamlana carrageenivorans]|uniref:Uncharacterized protein n=1 Tax=Pseudotamlana carrageenivorans TaxID=2069432 RepID=A0A2I7SIK7_9FLAO|nr:hypothetical protein C1A40_09820 [Tamlana carrageenivorans]